MPTQESCERLLHAMRALGDAKRSLVATDQLKGAAHLGVLGVLQDHGQLRIGELAEQLHVDISVMSRHIAHLENAGHIVRTADPSDKRSSYVRVTPEGSKALKAARKSIAVRLRSTLQSWDEQDVLTLATLLDRLSHSMHDPSPAHVPSASEATVPVAAPIN